MKQTFHYIFGYTLAFYDTLILQQNIPTLRRKRLLKAAINKRKRELIE